MIFLYVKQHIDTKLLYFGKTQRDPWTYDGSGTYWLNHLKKHGRNIETRKVWKFSDKQKCVDFALRFSKYHDITSSNLWGNLREENGLDGPPVGHVVSEETRIKLRNVQLGRKHSAETISKFKARRHSDDVKKRISETQKGVSRPSSAKPHTLETKKKISNKMSVVQLGKKRGPYKKRINKISVDES